MRGFYTGFMQISGMVYLTMATNLLMAVASLPLAMVFIFTDVRKTWLLAAVPAVLLAPTLAAEFAVFERFTSQGSIPVVATFVREWRAKFRRALVVGAVAVVGVAAFSVDIAVVWGHRVGAAAIPVFAMLIALVLTTAIHVLVATSLEIATRGLALAKLCLYLAVRKWYLSGLSIVALYLLTSFIIVEPAWGLGLAASPVLYLVWANSKYALRSALAPVATGPERVLA